MEVDETKARTIMEEEANEANLNLKQVIKDFERIKIQTSKEAVEEMKEEGILEEDYKPKVTGVYCISYDYEESDNHIATQGETEEEAYRMLFEAVALRRGLVGREVEDLRNIE